jgi:TolB-like protein/class 3 adenylate cyclase
VQRRLVAILAADVVGYSRLMGEDEAATLTTLRTLRAELLDPSFDLHGGRIFKTTGDGVLVEFSSVVEAVNCAIEIQQRMAAHNADLQENHSMQFRIGINLGDVVIEGGDIFGHGVNLASRLEGLAEPGGVCISAKVHEEVRGKIEASFEDLGERVLKNIAKPVRAYRLETGVSIQPTTYGASSSSMPSIAVLPFVNMSSDSEQQYFSDGITEDIITELSRFRSLFVIARNSSFQYRDKAVDIRRVARELGVRYVVEGSVRKIGASIRITAQLVDAQSGSHVWSERFDRDVDSLFTVQDEVTTTIVATLTGQIEDTEIKETASRKSGNIQAYDCYLRGVAHIRGYGVDDNQRARELFEQAIALDPGFAIAHAYLSLSLLVENGYGNAPLEIKDRAKDIALTAVQMDPRESRCQQFLGQAYAFRGEFDLAIAHMEQSTRLNPGDANSLASFGSVLGRAGRADEGVALIEKAMQLNPFHPEWYWSGLAIAFYAARRYEDCLAANQKIRYGKHHWQLARSAACLIRLGRLNEALVVASDVLRIKPDFHLKSEMPPYKHDSDSKHLFDAMREAGLPE